MFRAIQRAVDLEVKYTEIARELLSAFYKEKKDRKKIHEAVSNIKEALEINPEYSYAWLIQGLAQIQASIVAYKAGKFNTTLRKDSIKSFDKAIFVEKYVCAFVLKAYCLYSIGEANKALDELNKLRYTEATFDEGFNERCLVLAKQYYLRRLGQKLITFDSRNSGFESAYFIQKMFSTVLRILCLQALNRFDTAYKVIEDVLERSDIDGTSRLLILNLKGKTYYKETRYEEALDVFDKVISMQGKAFNYSDKVAYSTLIDKINCLRYLHRYAEAHTIIDTCFSSSDFQRLDAIGIDLCEQKIRLYELEGNYEKAMEWIEKETTNKDVNEGYFYRKAEYLFFLGRDSDALQKIEKIVDSDCSNVLKIYLLGIRGSILTKQESLEEAVKTFDKALKLIETEEKNCFYERIYTSNAQCLRLMGRYEDAHLIISKALELNNDFSDAYRVRGLLLLNEGNYEDAINIFEKANVYSSPAFYCDCALYLMLKGEFRKAIACMTKALELKKSSARVIVLKGFVSLLKGESFNAERFFLEAHAILSSGALPHTLRTKELSLLLDLGQGLLAHRQGDAAQMERKLKQPKIYEKSVWYYHLKGLCFMANKDYLEAQRVFKEGVAHTKDNKILNQCLLELQEAIEKGEEVGFVSDKEREVSLLQEKFGKAMEKLEDTTEAKEALQRSLDEISLEKVSLEKQKNELKAELSSLKKRIRTLEHKNTQMEATKEENRRLSLENEALRTEKEVLMSKVEKLNEDLSDIKKAITEKDHVIRDLRMAHERYKKENDARVAKLEKGQEKLKAQQKEKRNSQKSGAGFWNFGSKKLKDVEGDSAVELEQSQMRDRP